MFIAEPRKGFYRSRLIRDGIHVGVMIWHGRPVISGEGQDRSPRWCCAVDGFTTDDAGELLDPYGVWPWCAGHPISHREYAFLKRRRRWAKQHAPEHPAAQPRRPVDRRAMKPIF